MKTEEEIKNTPTCDTDTNERSRTRWMLKTMERTPMLAELKMTYRRKRPRAGQTAPVILTSPMSSETYLRTVWDADTIELREEFVLICLNTACEVLGWIKLFTGGIHSNPVDLRLLLGVALQCASSSIIVAHNHPSGSLTPSEDDRNVTKRIAKACKLVGLRCLDHVIVTREGAYSFSERESWLFQVDGRE